MLPRLHAMCDAMSEGGATVASTGPSDRVLPDQPPSRRLNPNWWMGKSSLAQAQQDLRAGSESSCSACTTAKRNLLIMEQRSTPAKYPSYFVCCATRSNWLTER